MFLAVFYILHSGTREELDILNMRTEYLRSYTHKQESPTWVMMCVLASFTNTQIHQHYICLIFIFLSQKNMGY